MYFVIEYDSDLAINPMGRCAVGDTLLRVRQIIANWLGTNELSRHRWEGWSRCRGTFVVEAYQKTPFPNAHAGDGSGYFVVAARRPWRHATAETPDNLSAFWAPESAQSVRKPTRRMMTIA